MAYWMGCTPEGDTRNFTRPRMAARSPDAPRPVLPTSTAELEAVLKLSEVEARPALLRTLEYFGGSRIDERMVCTPQIYWQTPHAREHTT